MQLLYKELVLAAHPTHLVFACMGALVLVPAYPFSVIFMFGCLGPYITLQYGRETGDARFTALLPVARCDVVRGKFLLIACLQLFSWRCPCRLPACAARWEWVEIRWAWMRRLPGMEWG